MDGSKGRVLLLLIAMLLGLQMPGMALADEDVAEEPILASEQDCLVWLNATDEEAAFWQGTSCDFAPEWVLGLDDRTEMFCEEWLDEDDVEAAFREGSPCRVVPDWLLMTQADVAGLCAEYDELANCEVQLFAEPGFRVFVMEQIKQQELSRRAKSVSSRSGGGRSANLANVEYLRPLVSEYFPSSLVNRALAVIDCESGGDATAKNPNSSASGLFQHLARLWPGRAEAAGIGANADIFNARNSVIVAWWLVNTSGWSHWNESKGCWAGF